MLEGLEISIINTKDLEKGLRIDSEIYQKEYIAYDNFIKEKEYTTFNQEALVVKKGIFDIKSAVYREKGIPFVRISNLRNMIIDTNDIIYIPEEENKKNLDTFLEEGDIILSKTAYPAASYVNIANCNTSQDTVAIKLSQQSNLLSEYIVIFLNSEIGLKQMRRRFTGNIQMHLNLEDCKTNLLIPILSTIFQNEIKNLFHKSIQRKDDSTYLYNKAEQLLLEELDLKDWEPSTENINSKSFKESFLTTGRLDAEYYQPKYEELLFKIRSFKTKPLGKIVSIIKSIEPGSDAYQDIGVPFVRVSDITKFEITEPSIHLDKHEYGELGLQPKKDTILLSKDGSVGIAYKLEQDMNIITSSALLHLEVLDNEFIPDYLALILNSVVVKLQAERDAGGSIIQHWKPSEIEEVIIPKLSEDIQQKITDKIQQSFALKRQSQYLLEVAKRAVEIAIEENEEMGMNYIKSNI